MSRHLLRAAAAGAVALLAGLVTAPAAQADDGEFLDRPEHITYIRVAHGPATVGIFANDNGISRRAHHHFWIDTNSSNPGPEYKAEVYQSSGRANLMRVANFDSSGIRFSCEGFRAESDPGHQQYVKVIIPRSCIGAPRRVRVAVVGYYANEPHIVDWAPGERRFYPWVNR
jgi:hypothetical protein